MTRVDLADWKDGWNVRQSRHYEVVCNRQYGYFKTVSLYRRPLTHTVSKALATSKKTAPVSRLSSEFLLTLSQRGQLQRRAVHGSEPKLLVAQLSALVYFPEEPTEQTFSSNLPIIFNTFIQEKTAVSLTRINTRTM
jgi:hypothetical protein